MKLPRDTTVEILDFEVWKTEHSFEGKIPDACVFVVENPTRAVLVEWKSGKWSDSDVAEKFKNGQAVATRDFGSTPVDEVVFCSEGSREMRADRQGAIKKRMRRGWGFHEAKCGTELKLH